MHNNVNVKDFGATGDGRTNDEPFIRAAMSVAFNAGNGGSVFFPAGEYAIESTLLVSDCNGGVLQGVGGKSVLRWRGGFHPEEPKPLLHIESCQNVAVRDLMIECAPPFRLAEGVRLTTKTGGVFVSAACQFENVRIAGNTDEVEICVRIGGDKDANNDFHQFVNCTFANYGDVGVEISDTQVYQLQFLNCRIGGSGWKRSNGKIEAGSTSLTHGQLFTTKDVGKYCEVVGAGPSDISDGGHHLRARIISVSGATCELDTPASVTVDGSEIISGAQCSVRARSRLDANKEGGSWSYIGGAVANNLFCDFYGPGHTGGNISLRDVIAESSRQFLVTGGLALGLQKLYQIEGCRIACDAVMNHQPFVIQFLLGGNLLILHTQIGDPNTGSVAQIQNAPDVTGFESLRSFIMIGCSIESPLATNNLIVGSKPTVILGCKHTFKEGQRVIPGRPSHRAVTQAESEATDVDALRKDFNLLLAQLRDPDGV